MNTAAHATKTRLENNRQNIIFGEEKSQKFFRTPLTLAPPLLLKR